MEAHLKGIAHAAFVSFLAVLFSEWTGQKNGMIVAVLAVALTALVRTYERGPKDAD